MPQSVIITGDKNMLVTVIRNLLTNAVKFTDAGGKVILDISPCECDTCGDVARNVSTKYVVSISDTGTGMTPEQMQNLFHIDRQYSKRGTANETGSGLGLIVCRDMLQKHGSSLNIESQEGKGSKFWFEI
jgi:signal transduction histidine kinase